MFPVLLSVCLNKRNKLGSQAFVLPKRRGLVWVNECCSLEGTKLSSLVGPTEEPVLGVHRGAGEQRSLWERWGRGGDLWTGRDASHVVGSRRRGGPDRLGGRMGLVSWWAGRLLRLGSIAPLQGVWTVCSLSDSSSFPVVWWQCLCFFSLGRPIHSRCCCCNNFYPGSVSSLPAPAPTSNTPQPWSVFFFLLC